jgi:cell wall-associated NlpC family hydrolase
MPAGMQLMLTADPEEYLSRAPLVRQGARAAAFDLAELRTAERELDAYGQAAADQLRELMAAKEAKAGARKRIERRLAQAEGLLSALEARQRARLERLEEAAAYGSQERWLHSGVAPGLGGAATAAGRTAVGYAAAQIGKPYQWGAEGPRTFDCSGLTSQAWAAAGRAIPRTSQEQWARLPHVPLGDMRPGDLVVYFDDASHVGIYVGDGAIVHAPRPGRTVTLAGAGSMPILGVVRPDG